MKAAEIGRAFLIVGVCAVAIGLLWAEDCTTPDLTLTYPRLANMANVTGDVVLHIGIGPDGIPVILRLKGKQERKLTRLLSTGAREAALDWSGSAPIRPGDSFRSAAHLFVST